MGLNLMVKFFKMDKETSIIIHKIKVSQAFRVFIRIMEISKSTRTIHIWFK